MIALLGGTFDPVHFGHLRPAVEVRDRLQAMDFRFLPAGRPPHRQSAVTAAEHRVAMLRLALEDMDGMMVDERELRRPGPSYMADTLEELR